MRNGKYALFLVADSQSANRGDVALKYEQTVELPYEDELISCIECWREYGGIFSDIPIYVHCPTKHGIQKDTERAITRMGARYVHTHVRETDDYVCGYLNVPLSGKIIESTIPEDIIIHIDLDMRLVKEPDEGYFNISEGSLALIGINEWRPTDRYPDIGYIFPHEANTGFIVSRKEDHFYEKWYNELWRFLSRKDANDPAYSIYEERIIDYMYFNWGYKFDFIRNFQVNGDVSDYTDEEVLNIRFFHGHLNMVERNKRYMEIYVRKYAQALRNKRLR